MNTNNTNANNANANDGKNAAKEQLSGFELGAAIAAVRGAIRDLQTRIDAQTDPLEKAELIKQMKALTADIGFVFDDNKEAAEAAAKETINKLEETVNDIKPSIWQRIKNFVAPKYQASKTFVVEHKVVISVTLATIVAAVAALVVLRRNGTINFNRGISEATLEVTGEPVVETRTADSIDQAQASASSFFNKVGEVAIRGAVGAKNLVVDAAHRVGNFFTKKSVTPYTVSGDVSFEAPVAA